MFEPHFGDLGDVRLHDHPQAQASAAGLGARAFTAGRDIGFARGELTPQGAEGRRLLGHELAHVAQAGDVVRRSPDEELEEESEKPKAAPPYPVFTDDQIYAPLKASEDDDRQAEAAATEMRMLRSVVRQALEADVALTQRGTRDNRYARERLETFEETGYLPDRRVNMDGGAAGMNLAFSTGLPTTLKTAAIMAAFAALAFFFPPAAAALGGWIAGISIGEMLTGRSSGALNPLRLLEGDFQMGRELSLFERIVSGVTALLSILGVRASAAAAGPKIVSPVYRFAERDIVIVETSLGRQAFYRSTGENSGMVGKWLPFDEVIRAEIKTANGDIKVIEDWFNKLAYTEGVPKGTPLHRLGTEEFAAISEGLGKANLPMGEALATKEEVNAILDTFGARLNEYVMKRRPPP